MSWRTGAWKRADYIEKVASERIRGKTSKRSWILFKLTWLVGCPADRAPRGSTRRPGFEAKCRTLRLLRDEAAMLAEDAAALVPIGKSAGRSR
ncbi:MAG: hypothetical protein U0835_22910 [Isosphaeraceae bacterium]